MPSPWFCCLGRSLSVITQFDGLLITLRDGRCGKYLQQNGTGIATGAVLVLGGQYSE